MDQVDYYLYLYGLTYTVKPALESICI